MTYSKEKELEALFQQAVDLHHNNELDQACEIYTTLLDIVPDSPIVLFNLGLVLFQQGHYEESEQCYRFALELVPGENDILYNLALCLKCQGRFTEVIDIYNRILEENPKDIDSLYNLGCCLKDMHKDYAAMEVFAEVLTLSEEYESAANNLAYLYHKHDEKEKAQKVYRRLLRINPEHHAARHMLNSLKGITTTTMPSTYVASVFDDFSDYFDDKLVNHLSYKVPTLLKTLYDKQFPDSGPHTCLDLGCGTGLSGMAFRLDCRSITGVDLSSKMLSQAGQKGIYDELIQSDICDFLRKTSQNFSLFLAADVFPYFGELRTILSAAMDNSIFGGIMCFSVEKSESSSYLLQDTGRFAHSKEYVEEQCLDSGWSVIELVSTQIRKEKDSWIEGYIVIVQNSGQNRSTQ